MFTVMTTWKRGRQILQERLQSGKLPTRVFVNDMAANPPVRVPGTAVYLDSNARGTPASMLHNLKHNRVLHERVIFLSVVTQETPYVSDDQRYKIVPLGAGIHRVTIHVGFVEHVDLPHLLSRCPIDGVPFDVMRTSFLVGRERVIATDRPGMALWRERLFSAMSRNAEGVTRHFNLPVNRVVELGVQVEI